MMTTYSMPALSSLEFMLQKIQQLENEPKDVPPPLPVRPVSKGRLPSRPRRLLRNNFQSSGADANKHKNLSDSTKVFVESAHQQQSENGDIAAVAAYARKSADEQVQIERLDDTREGKVKGALVFQRCFRGYQARRYYNELKSSVISLQSFIRGENERKAYQQLLIRLRDSTTMQKQRKQYSKIDQFEGQHRAILCLQSGIRRWLTRRHHNRTENRKNLPDEKIKAKQVHDKNNPDMKDHTWTPCPFLVNLQRQVLRTEAALRNKEAENAALRKNINQYEKRWMEYEAKMIYMEKMWQDQLKSMQISLAAAKKGVAAEKAMRISQRFEASPSMKPTGNGTSTEIETQYRRSREKFYDLPHEADLQVTEAELQVNSSRANSISGLNISQHGIVFDDDDDDGNFVRIKSERWISSKDIGAEVQKLDHTFDAWKKEYRIKLAEAEATMKKLAHADKETGGKRWWRRKR